MHILITGGAGFIGSHTVDALLEKGHEVRILDNLQKQVHLKGKPPWIPKEAEFILGDVRNKADWEIAMAGIDAVYHFAAYQDYLPDFSTFFHVNTVGTALLYEVAVEQKMDLAKVIVAGSQFVQGEGLYRCPTCEKQVAPTMRPESQLRKGVWEHLCPECGETSKWQWTPETHVSPPSAYAMAKYSQEMQAMTFGRRYGIPSVVLRYSIVQGSRQSFYNAYSGACRIFSLNYYFCKSPTLYEDGLQCRDFVNIHDVVRANILALENGRMNYEVFNVGGGRAYTVREFAGIVKKELEGKKVRRKDEHRTSNVQHRTSNGKTREEGSEGRKGCRKKVERIGELPKPEVPGLYRFGDTRNACSNITKIKALGWKPQYSPEESVREYVDWLYEQENVEDILEYAERTMKEMGVVRAAFVNS